MLASVPVMQKSLREYEPFVGEETIARLRALAAPLQGARVLHINATAFGGGVAELLATLVPLLNDTGLVADWQVIRGNDQFFNVTKAMHNALQGMYIDWTPDMFDLWQRTNQMNAELLDRNYDFVVVHDPQPAGLLHYYTGLDGRQKTGYWIWRCHIDTTTAQLAIWDFIRPYLARYDAAVFTMQSYVKEDLHGPLIAIIPPAIDPLSPKNMDLSRETAEDVLRRYGIDTRRPIMLQVSRFDPWKDPFGVIDAYRLVKREIPGLQLVMVASMASDDPEGWSYYERTARRAGEDYDIHLLSNLNGVGNVEVNAFQRLSDVVLQKSLREGFGLVVAEALWKGKPVVGGNVGGIPLQVIDGQTGYLVGSVEECAERSLDLLQHPGRAAEMGRAGREHIRQNFLSTRNLERYLHLFHRLAGTGPDYGTGQDSHSNVGEVGSGTRPGSP